MHSSRMQLSEQLKVVKEAEEFVNERHRWNTNEEIASLLVAFSKHSKWLTKETQIRPASGSMFLFNRKQTRYNKDGYLWKKRKDGSSPRVDHMKLKINGSECINGCYVHSAIIPTFHRRSYWLLHNPDLVLVHYLNVSISSNNNTNNLITQFNTNTFFTPLTNTIQPFIIDQNNNIFINKCSNKNNKMWSKNELKSQITPMFTSLKHMSPSLLPSTTVERSIDFIVESLLEQQNQHTQNFLLQQNTSNLLQQKINNKPHSTPQNNIQFLGMSHNTTNTNTSSFKKNTSINEIPLINTDPLFAQPVSEVFQPQLTNNFPHQQQIPQQKCNNPQKPTQNATSPLLHDNVELFDHNDYEHFWKSSLFDFETLPQPNSILLHESHLNPQHQHHQKHNHNQQQKNLQATFNVDAFFNNPPNLKNNNNFNKEHNITNSNNNNNNTNNIEESEKSVDYFPPSSSSSLPHHQPIRFQILDFTPDWAPTEGGTKIMITGVFSHTLQTSCHQPPHFTDGELVVKFGDCVVEATILQAGVIKCYAPSHGVAEISISIQYKGQAISQSMPFKFKQVIVKEDVVWDHLEEKDRRKMLKNRINHLLSKAATPLDKAVIHNLIKCLKIEGADASAIVSDGVSHNNDDVDIDGKYLVSHLTASLGLNRLLSFLISLKQAEGLSTELWRDLDVDALDFHGNTPIMWTCAYKHMTSFALLFQKIPQSFSVPNQRGQLPFNYIKQHGNEFFYGSVNKDEAGKCQRVGEGGDDIVGSNSLNSEGCDVVGRDGGVVSDVFNGNLVDGHMASFQIAESSKTLLESLNNENSEDNCDLIKDINFINMNNNSTNTNNNNNKNNKNKRELLKRFSLTEDGLNYMSKTTRSTKTDWPTDNEPHLCFQRSLKGQHPPIIFGHSSSKDFFLKKQNQHLTERLSVDVLVTEGHNNNNNNINNNNNNNNKEYNDVNINNNNSLLQKKMKNRPCKSLDLTLGGVSRVNLQQSTKYHESTHTSDDVRKEDDEVLLEGCSFDPDRIYTNVENGHFELFHDSEEDEDDFLKCLQMEVDDKEEEKDGVVNLALQIIAAMPARNKNEPSTPPSPQPDHHSHFNTAQLHQEKFRDVTQHLQKNDLPLYQDMVLQRKQDGGPQNEALNNDNVNILSQQQKQQTFLEQQLLLLQQQLQPQTTQQQVDFHLQQLSHLSDNLSPSSSLQQHLQLQNIQQLQAQQTIQPQQRQLQTQQHQHSSQQNYQYQHIMNHQLSDINLDYFFNNQSIDQQPYAQSQNKQANHSLFQQNQQNTHDFLQPSFLQNQQSQHSLQQQPPLQLDIQQQQQQDITHNKTTADDSGISTPSNNLYFSLMDYRNLEQFSPPSSTLSSTSTTPFINHHQINSPTIADFSEFFNAPDTFMEKDFSKLTLSDHEQRNLYRAAKVIQRSYRRSKSTHHIQQAATLIQACFRRYKQFMYYKKMTQAAVLIQSQFRSYYAQKKFRRSRQAATIIQSKYRAYKQHERYMKSRNAAVIIQQRFRNHYQRSLIKKQTPLIVSGDVIKKMNF